MMRTKRGLRIILIGFSIIIGNLIGFLLGKNIIFWERNNWSIGIYRGFNPFSLKPSTKVINPILTAKHVTDVKAEFVADPFLIKENSKWYLFFEVMNSKTKKGEIGFATSENGWDWTYERIVISESFHLSYPYVFKNNNSFYMIPETTKANSVRLYKAVEFPHNWKFVTKLLNGYHVDPSIFKTDELWFLLTETKKYPYGTLSLFFAENLTGPWKEHPKSPIIKDDHSRARPAGRVITLNENKIRFSQDSTKNYGDSIKAFKITKITEDDYEEKEIDNNPILAASGSGWNEKGMHHVDPFQINEKMWIAVVDGLASSKFFIIND